MTLILLNTCSNCQESLFFSLLSILHSDSFLVVRRLFRSISYFVCIVSLESEVSVHVMQHKGFVRKDKDMYPTSHRAEEHKAPKHTISISKITTSIENILHKYNYIKVASRQTEAPKVPQQYQAKWHTLIAYSKRQDQRYSNAFDALISHWL